MGLVVVGLSHKTAPIGLRERLTVPAERLAPALDQLMATKEVAEVVILSTCNRLEIYGRPVCEKAGAFKVISHFFQNLYDHAELESALYRHEAHNAIKHLFRVAAGLDSLVVGETEVLGQVKSAYGFAHAHGATGKITNVLFQRALFVGKQIRQRTRLSEGSSSVGSVAVHLAERIFGRLDQHRILLLGAGKMAEVIARHLLSQKAGQLVILNRTFQKAQELAALLNGVAAPIDALHDELIKADIVICSTAAERPIITKEMIDPIMKTRRGRSLYFIDIAVPRNVDPSIHDLDNAYVYNIDDLKSLVDESMARRQQEVAAAESIVDKASHDFYEWTAAVLRGDTAALRHQP